MGSMIRRKLHRITEPQILFPGSAVVTLLLIWGATLFYVRVLRAELEVHSLASTEQILETYEAQVIRSLDEIDQAMNLVTWWRGQGPDRSIAQLTERELLPPELVFGVSVIDAQGRIVDTNQSTTASDGSSPGYIESLRAGDRVVVAYPTLAPDGRSTLQFARRLEAPAGEFGGAVVVEVDADFFVSSYEDAVMGQRGLLALVDTDGALRVQRSGEQASTDASGFGILPERDGRARRESGAASGQQRWIAAREVFDSPLVVVAGLSVDEQFEALRDRERGYYILAAVASLICVIALALLGRFSWQLARSRAREVQIRQAHAERVEYLAYHDGLTGLANRSLFSKLLSQSLAEAMRYQRQLAVVYMDLDRFKPINDTLGHEAGDQLLKEIARRLQSCVRSSDTVARLGGDEFVVLLPQLQGEGEIVAVAGKILGAVGEPMMLLGREVCVTASIGIALAPRDGRDEETLKKNADAAMYQAKAQGKNNFQFYTDKLSSTSLERLSLEANLRHALERDQLRIYYQARHDLATGRVTGMEALLHWEHPDIGVIPPSRFLPVAEESGVIIPIGRWALKTACAQSVALRRQGMPELCVTVNVSAAQFYDDRLLEDVRGALTQAGLAPRLLELAIPETALTHRPELTRLLLQGLRKLGVRIAIGDFGFGYAWLDALRDFSFDTIKIDRSLTRHVAVSEQGAALAHAVIAVGRRLSGSVVAQGAGSADEAQLLRSHGAGSLQGGCAGEPLPPEQFAAAMNKHEVTVLVPTRAPAGSSKSRAG